MNDNLSIFITIIVLVILLVIFPLYNHFERQDDMSYNLVLKTTTNFIDSVINCGYIDQQMYSDYISQIANTGNLYDIQLEAHKKIITTDIENTDNYQDQYIIDYNYDIFNEEGTTKDSSVDGNIRAQLNNKSLKNGIYKLDVGDQIYIKVKNSGTTMAESLFKNIVPTANSKNITVNYGGIIKNNAWLKVDNSVVSKKLISLKYKINGVISKTEEEYLYYGEKDVEFDISYNISSNPNFKGWRKAGSESLEPEYKEGENSTIKLTEDLTLEAVIYDSEPTIIFNTYTTQTFPSRKVKVNEPYGNLPELTNAKEGHTFIGWYTEKTGGNLITKDTIVTTTENHTIHARWEENEYTVTFDYNGGNGSVVSKTVKYDGTYGNLPIPTRTNYTFTGWFTDANYNVTNTTKVTRTADHTLKAHWKKDVKVTLNVNGGKALTNSIMYIKVNGKYEGIEDIEPSRDNCTFVGWFTEIDGGTKITDSDTLRSNSNHTLYAQWKPKAYYRITKNDSSNYYIYKLKGTYLEATSEKVPDNKVYKVKSTNKKASGSGSGIEFWHIENEDIYINKEAFTTK